MANGNYMLNAKICKYYLNKKAEIRTKRLTAGMSYKMLPESVSIFKNMWLKFCIFYFLITCV